MRIPVVILFIKSTKRLIKKGEIVMSAKKKIFIFFFVFTLVSFGLFSSVNVHAGGEL